MWLKTDDLEIFHRYLWQVFSMVTHKVLDYYSENICEVIVFLFSSRNIHPRVHIRTVLSIVNVFFSRVKSLRHCFRPLKCLLVWVTQSVNVHQYSDRKYQF